MKNIKFYSLLYVKDGAQNLVHNFGSKSKNPPKLKDIQLYTACCLNLQRSLQAHGFSYAVITNAPALLNEADSALNTISIDFPLEVPEGISFYGAHHKIDVFRWFAQQRGDYSFLLDLDVVCANPMPPNMLAAVQGGLPLYYDITDQVYPEVGRERVIADKKLVCAEADLGLWAGGEFIGGEADFFAELSGQIERISAAYFAVHDKLFHQSDESLTATALELLLKRGVPMVNAGAFNGIARYWSCGTEHCQKLYAAVKDSFLLHLPADKNFLASTPYSEGFLPAYERYLRCEKAFDTEMRLPRLFWVRVKNKLKRLARLK